MEYFLSLQQQMDISRIGLSKCKEHWGIYDRQMPDNEVIIVYRGKLNCSVDNRSFIVHEGEACILPGGTNCSQFTENHTCRFYYAHFRDSLQPVLPQLRETILHEKLQRQGINAETPDIYILPPAAGPVNLLLAEKMSCGTHMDEISTLFAKALIERNFNSVGRLMLIAFQLTHAVVLLSRYYTSKVLAGQLNQLSQNKLIQDAIAYIEANYHLPITAQALSENFAVSQQYLSRLFKRELGLSPIKYINEFRIKKAKNLLSSTDQNVSEIAFQVGFDTLYYFSRVFKQYEGISPSVYRLWLNSKSNE